MLFITGSPDEGVCQNFSAYSDADPCRFQNNGRTAFGTCPGIETNQGGAVSVREMSLTLPVTRCSTESFITKVAWGERDKDCLPKIGLIDPGGGLDDCCAGFGCRPWSCRTFKVVMKGA